MGQCRCRAGFTGDGAVVCVDIDECVTVISPCHTHANCSNQLGSYTCTCIEGYVGDGHNCVDARSCTSDLECHRHAHCGEGGLCYCEDGFIGNGKHTCENVDECSLETHVCHEHAECTDTEGGYTCTCLPGYNGDGFTCQNIPRDCQDILDQDPAATNGEYLIDPDAVGGVNPFKVICDFTSEMGIAITYIRHNIETDQNMPGGHDPYGWTKTITYYWGVTLTQMRALIAVSGYCYQQVTYQTFYLNPVDKVAWFDGLRSRHNLQQCPCELVHACVDNLCRGDTHIEIIDKRLLPVTSLMMGGSSNSWDVDYLATPLYCSPRQTRIPRDCEDARLNYGLSKSRVLYIDVDGPPSAQQEGPNHAPMLVYCDLDSYPGIAVTVVSPSSPEPLDPLTGPSYTGTVTYPVTGGPGSTTSGQGYPGTGLEATGPPSNGTGSPLTTTESAGTVTTPFYGFGDLDYPVPLPAIHVLALNSPFCIQHVVYTCESSLLLNGGTAWTAYNGDVMNTWGSAEEYVGTCACAVLGMCESEGANCNCDAQDGVQRTDLGWLMDRSALPVKGFAVADQSENSSYSGHIGPLRCAPRQIDILPSCQDYRDQGFSYSYVFLVDPDGTEPVPPTHVYCDMDEPHVGCAILEKNDISDFAAVVRGRASHCVDWVEYNNFERCCELWPTCADLWTGYQVPTGSNPLIDDNYTIDPDGTGPLAPFLVYCDFPYKTIINPIDGLRPYLDSRWQNVDDYVNNPASCGDVIYGPDVTLPQLQALAGVSGFCEQGVYYDCINAGFTNNVRIFDPNGQRIDNWGNAQTNSSVCGCGAQGACLDAQGRRDVTLACNCDAPGSDDVASRDEGTLIDKRVLPVSRVCLGMDPAQLGQGYRRAKVNIQALTCMPIQLGVVPTCQEVRTVRRATADEVYWIDPDGMALDSNPPFPAYCDLDPQVPYGITEVTHTEFDTCMEVGQGGLDVTITYNQATVEQLTDLIAASQYCTQRLEYICSAGAVLELGGAEGLGWYSEHNDAMPYWGGNTGGAGCMGGACRCSGDNLDPETDGGLLLDGSVLPVTRLRLSRPTGANGTAGSENASACVTLGPLICYHVFRTCDEIWQQDHQAQNGRFPIDPDLNLSPDGGVAPFSVDCDFRILANSGVTSVSPADLEERPLHGNETLSYSGATHAQLRALVHASPSCQQELFYGCEAAPLLNDFSPYVTAFTSASGAVSRSWPGADFYGKEGCACVVLGTCGADNATCRCDAWQGPGVIQEGGVITHSDLLPVTSLLHDPTVTSGSEVSSTYRLGALLCAPAFVDLPSHCHDAREKGYPTGELLIEPSTDLEPFLVYCEMDGDIAVTVVYNEVSPRTPAAQLQEVTYRGASTAQLRQLVLRSGYCYQPQRVDCRASQLFSNYDNYWLDWQGYKRRFLGEGRGRDCDCGTIDKCGGGDSVVLMQSRKCNCDMGDNVTRADAGVLDSRNYLPITGFHVEAGPGGEVYVSLGNLYCTNQYLDIDNCALGYHDCHEWADCLYLRGKYDCRCREGYRGRNRPDVWANGRECYDDNECLGVGVCPPTADCVNTVGSFQCVCKPGFRWTGPNTCVDIDECAEGTHSCDVNGRCHNRLGYYTCSCNSGYKGTGWVGQCHAMGQCFCLGDPHCLSFDNRWSHFQGACSYTLARDGCESGIPSGEPTFHVTLTNYRKPELVWDAPVSWPKQVTVYVYNHEVVLSGDRQVYFDGLLIQRLPAQPLRHQPDLVFTRNSESLVVTWASGVEVHWKHEKAAVFVPASYKSRVCGLCGNYNDLDSDDWTVGDSCPEEAGNITTSTNRFGNSWTYTTGSNSDPQCDVDCSPVDPRLCEAEKFLAAENECEQLLDPMGRFGTCISAASWEPGMLDGLRYACVEDMCLLDGDVTLGLCTHAQHLASLCEDRGVPAVRWRADGFCTMECAEGLEYAECAQPCQPTCVAQTVDMSDITCQAPCREMCVCPHDMVLDGDRCVPPDECGCNDVESGIYYSVGDRIVSEVCSQESFCRVPGLPLESQPLSCVNYSACVVQDGVLDCYCVEGFVMNAEGECEDDDECSRPDTCDPDATCLNTFGSHTCTCNQGYHGDGKLCDDDDECIAGNFTCDSNADCVNVPGSYECHCREGFRVTVGGVCTDVDECSGSGGSRCDVISTVCNNTLGGYECLCEEGFVRHDQYTCSDVDECADPELNTCHEFANCHNEIGNYTCRCRAGFRDESLTGLDLGRSCSDVDECSDPRRRVCHQMARCNNTVGGYTCTCKMGYEGDGYTECIGVPPECDDPCGENEVCEWVTPTTGDCVCRHGFEPVLQPDSTTRCVDVDECALPDTCHEMARCFNLIGSHVCLCQSGFQGDGYTCTDMPECALGLDRCDEHARCVNTVGSYTCACLPGYEGVPGALHCRNIDECARNEHVCGEHTECVDTPGSYMCQCLPGYAGHCHDCQDIDECMTGQNNCHPHLGRCSNTEGSFRCECAPGYQGNGVTCQDENECILGSHTCDTHAQCVNTAGSYTCDCMLGYILVPEDMSCRDINECRTSAYTCAEHALCHNTAGSYHCECSDGYFLVGGHCQEETTRHCGYQMCDRYALCDEALDPADSQCRCRPGYTGPAFINSTQPIGCTLEDPCSSLVCDVHAHCLSAGPLAVCSCATGYHGDGFICQPLPNACELPDTCGQGAECISAEEASSNFTCECLPGFEFNELEDSCTDIDECSVGVSGLEGSGLVCGPHSLCVNTPGNHVCLCHQGYRHSGDYCTNVDECAEGQHGCGAHAQCLDTDGGYECSCDSGYHSSPVHQGCLVTPTCFEDCGAGTVCVSTGGNNTCVCQEGYEDTSQEGQHIQCIDVDECSGLHNCDVNALCLNTEGSFVCQCQDGWRGSGYFCEDVDECELHSHECHRHARCVNSLGGYECACLPGYTGDGRECTPEHGTDPCGCGAFGSCDPVSGHCDCYHGYELDAGRRENRCRDIDECARDAPCHALATCANTPGGYSCACGAGLLGNGYALCEPDACSAAALSAGSEEGQCSEFADCLVLPGGEGKQCVCWPGYTGDGHSCTRLSDPCDQLSPEEQCGAHALCVPLDGAPVCVCEAGYQGDGESCSDVNECLATEQEFRHDCHSNAICHNMDGSFVCVCAPGFQGNGRSCEDIDECADSPDGHGPCGAQADCSNTEGGVRCACKPGLEGEGSSCKPGSGCSEACDTNEQCGSTEWGGVLCLCAEGFQGQPGNCTDIDECAMNATDCDVNADCVNSLGGHDCVCREGFEGDAAFCVDVDECSSQILPCGEHAACHNSPGSFSCCCVTGYRLDNETAECFDIDECSEQLSQCDQDADCSNKDGGHLCACRPSYYGDGLNCTACPVGGCEVCLPGYTFTGSSCEEVDECVAPPSSSRAHQCEGGSDCRDTQQGYTCECRAGFERVSDLRCDDIDECTRTPDLCGPHSSGCVNRPGSYLCMCLPGFRNTPQGCDDVDECTTLRPVCGPRSAARCINTAGNYSCVCHTGYRLDPVRRKCTDIDECAETPVLCGVDTLCINSPGAYTCHCPSGLIQGPAGTCINVDECALGRHACDVHADCSDTPGSYTCRCHPGYIGDGRRCSPICYPGICRPQETCEVLNGRPTCVCKCTSPDCMNPGQVCGSDGQTYSSDAELILQACRTGSALTRAYRGVCKDSCNDTVCSVQKQCVVRVGVPRCECIPCTQQEWESGPVCSARGDTYPNACLLKQVQCAKDGDDTLASEGPCVPTECRYSAWAPWPGCSVTCGLGSKSRTRGVIARPTGDATECRQTSHTAPCYRAACRGDPCFGHACPRAGARCVVRAGAAICECPVCTGEPVAPLCGLVGQQLISQDNLCRLQLYACLRNEPYQVLHGGRCRDGEPNEPMTCSLLPFYQKVNDPDGCVSRETVQTNTCRGPCGDHTGVCCKPASVEYVQQVFDCQGLPNRVYKVARVTGCACEAEGSQLQYEALEHLPGYANQTIFNVL